MARFGHIKWANSLSNRPTGAKAHTLNCTQYDASRTRIYYSLWSFCNKPETHMTPLRCNWNRHGRYSRQKHVPLTSHRSAQQPGSSIIRHSSPSFYLSLSPSLSLSLCLHISHSMTIFDTRTWALRMQETHVDALFIKYHVSVHIFASLDSFTFGFVLLLLLISLGCVARRHCFAVDIVHLI